MSKRESETGYCRGVSSLSPEETLTPTNFEKVLEFNRTMGVLDDTSADPLTLVPVPDVFEKSPKLVSDCIALVDEEHKELHDAIVACDYVETADALVDLLYVTYGMAARIGLNADLLFELVHANNMSKTCETEEEAKESVKKYMSMLPHSPYDTPDYRRSLFGNRWIVFNRSTGKILKSHKWTEVDLSFLARESCKIADDDNPIEPANKRKKT